MTDTGKSVRERITDDTEVIGGVKDQRAALLYHSGLERRDGGVAKEDEATGGLVGSERAKNRRISRRERRKI